MTSPLSWQSFYLRFCSDWNLFFHSSINPRVLQLLRITYGLVLLVNLFTWLPGLDLWFGEAGVLPKEIWVQSSHAYDWTLLNWLGTTSGTLHACFWCFAAQTCLLLIGMSPRWNAACVFLWLVSFQNRNPLILDGEDAVMRLIGFYLIWMPWKSSATARLLDSTTTAISTVTQPSSGWALRMLQLQMCVIFFASACAKIHGQTWIDGTAVYYASRLDEFAQHRVWSEFVFNSPWIVAGLTWGTLLVEFCAPVLIWFRETRRVALFAVLAFHVGCELSFQLFLFHAIMICGWFAFVEEEDWWAIRRMLSHAISVAARGLGPRPTYSR